MNGTDRCGIEQFTSACRPVVWDQSRADAGLPPWVSQLDGQCFMESEVKEDDEG